MTLNGNFTAAFMNASVSPAMSPAEGSPDARSSLDRAVWRRFQLRLHLPAPTRAQREAFFERFAARVGYDLGVSARTLADRLDGLSFAELEELCADIQRRYVLALPDADPKTIVKERLAQWSKRYRASNAASSPEVHA